MAPTTQWTKARKTQLSFSFFLAFALALPTMGLSEKANARNACADAFTAQPPSTWNESLGPLWEPAFMELHGQLGREKDVQTVLQDFLTKNVDRLQKFLVVRGFQVESPWALLRLATDVSETQFHSRAHWKRVQRPQPRRAYGARAPLVRVFQFVDTIRDVTSYNDEDWVRFEIEILEADSLLWVNQVRIERMDLAARDKMINLLKADFSSYVVHEQTIPEMKSLGIKSEDLFRKSNWVYIKHVDSSNIGEIGPRFVYVGPPYKLGTQWRKEWLRERRLQIDFAPDVAGKPKLAIGFWNF